MQFESLELRRLMAWSSYAQLVDQDQAATDYSTITGKGVVVADIDTGVDYNLASLGGGFGANFKVIGGYDFYDDDADPMDESGHGTAVASVIAANPYTTGGVTYQGVAPDAKLIALRVGTDTDISNANIERALQWVIDNVKNGTYNISVVNLSLGSGNYTQAQTDSNMSALYKTLREMGIFVVAASGNSNDQNSGPISQDGIAYPSADPNVFAVAAVDSSDVITSWAQRGSELDLLAPGVDIVTPETGGGFVTEDGTSFASPYVAGTAALIKQKDPGVLAGDIGSILMSSGVANRDGDAETGNTTDLLFSRLDIDAALALTARRSGKSTVLALGKSFDTVLDSQGVLHAAYYDTAAGNLLYATRSTSGKWSPSQTIDSAGDVGAQISIAIDAAGKVGIGYYDVTNSGVKYAGFNGVKWSTTTIDADKFVGTSPSLAFTIDGDAYLAYYRKSGGYLRLAHLNRDTNRWSRRTVDGGNGANVGADLALDIGEAPQHLGPFTTYDTTIAIAYADSTNGNLKYARLDIDKPGAAWFISTVDDTSGVGNIDVNLHNGPSNVGLQAQMSYLDATSRTVKYAYLFNTWKIEKVASGHTYGETQLYFDANDIPSIGYYDGTKAHIYTAVRSGGGVWRSSLNSLTSGLFSISYNERTGDSTLVYLNRKRTAISNANLV